MITLHKNLKDREQYEKVLRHSEDVFEIAREIFYQNEEVREKAIAVENEEKEILYYLIYECNQISPLDYVDDFWEYDISDEQIDYELIDRSQVYIFLEFEEYTYQIARIIQQRYQDRDIFFTDSKAVLFFNEGDGIHIVSSINDIYNNYRSCISKSIMTIDSNKGFLHNTMRFIIKRYRSLSVMTSLFWKSNKHSFGNENPDKTFYLIKNTIDNGGIADLIKFTLYRVVMAEEKNLIPIIDLSVEGDNNQFNNGDGTNAWTMYFEQITDISLDEVYRSQNVIIAKDKLDLFNPYILEKHYFADWKEMFKKYLKFNKSTNDFINDLYNQKMPKNHEKVLGVIGRGTDYRANKGRWTPEPMEPEDFIKEVIEAREEWEVKYIFLATEDENIYRMFMKSSLKESIIEVEQERIDYEDEKNKNLFLSEIKARDKINGYYDGLRYLGILWLLSKCNSLISTCVCGASQCAIAFNDGKYENVRVF